ncbi:MAG: hypothetical protein EBZ05_06015 [Verrucomicrobia bacterium]|nr:hypothetical protein [Verrucomicrobiota bacterium]
MVLRQPIRPMRHKNMKRIIYPNNEGGVSVIVPSPNWNGTIEELALKDVPAGKPFKIIDASEIPSDRTFRNAWEYQE